MKFLHFQFHTLLENFKKETTINCHCKQLNHKKLDSFLLEVVIHNKVFVIALEPFTWNNEYVITYKFILNIRR